MVIRQTLLTQMHYEVTPATNTGLAKVAVQCSADTSVVKIATFAKPETVGGNFTKQNVEHKKV